MIVIGTSAGGLKALTGLLSQLREGFPAPILVVQHISADATGDVLLDALNRATKLKCQHASTNTELNAGNLYLAPSDHHLMVDGGLKLLVTKGAVENRSRPAIDPLFRSAAVAFGDRLIGILLTGYLDDGTAGLIAIQRCGGICIVQDPADADYPDMPRNALNQLTPDHCLPLAEMGGVLYELMNRKIGRRRAVPKDILIESTIAERVLSDLPSVNALGKQCLLTALIAAVFYGRLKAGLAFDIAATPATLIPRPRYWRNKTKRSKKPCGSRCECLKNERTC